MNWGWRGCPRPQPGIVTPVHITGNVQALKCVQRMNINVIVGRCIRNRELLLERVVGGWWLLVGGCLGEWWLVVVGGWWASGGRVVGEWWLVVA